MLFLCKNLVFLIFQPFFYADVSVKDFPTVH